MEDARFSRHDREFIQPNLMSSQGVVPVFEDRFPDLHQFILELVRDYEAASIRSWDDLEVQVKAYFTPERMQQMDSLVPGWQTMAAYTDGITLVHVMCVFLGSFMLPEYQALTLEQQQMEKWIVLLHDITKFHIPGKKDTMHAFRSGVHTANLLPHFGFRTRQKYSERIGPWSKYAAGAFIPGAADTAPRPDNQKLPGILIGIDNLFGRNTPAALITKTVLLHISLDVDPFYPTPAPLTEEESGLYIDSSLLPLLRVMMLADNEGWSLFDPETRTRQRIGTLNAFRKLERLISD